MEQSILFINDAIVPKDGERHQIKPFTIGNSDVSRNLPVAIVAVVGANREIGKGGDLIWHIPEDLRHFKELTFGGAVVMGRKTWESLPRKPLPGRLNVVVTRSGIPQTPGVVTASSIEEALEKGKGNPIFIIGGGEIYRQSMKFADRLYLTEVAAEDSGADTYFPEISPADWAREEESEEMTSSKGPRYRFVGYRRI